MHRKMFLQQIAALGFFWPVRRFVKDASSFFTVTGPLDTKRLGYILPHEHLLVDFIGAELVAPDRYDRSAVVAQMLPRVQDAKDAGCTAFFDCTPAYLGRDVALLRTLSQNTGLPIVTNTGYYSAVNHKYLPAHAFTETAEQLADRWIDEFNHGIDGTEIRPGFIKISVDKDPLDEVSQKIVLAAALTHKATGLTINSHTGNGRAALEQLDILKKAGVSPSAFVWTHAQNEEDRSLHRAAGKRGAWIAFDNLGWAPVSVYLDHIRFMEGAGLLRRMLVSHDAGWYDVTEKGANEIKPFTPLFKELIPALQQEGWKEAKLRQLFRDNPVDAYSVRRRVGRQGV